VVREVAINCNECDAKKMKVVAIWRLCVPFGSRSWLFALGILTCYDCGIYRVLNADDLKKEELNGRGNGGSKG